MARRGIKLKNPYVDDIGSRFYKDTPKAVFAALAVSYLHLLEGDDDLCVPKYLVKEWKTLHENGLVPQKPPSESEG